MNEELVLFLAAGWGIFPTGKWQVFYDLLMTSSTLPPMGHEGTLHREYEGGQGSLLLERDPQQLFKSPATAMLCGPCSVLDGFIPIQWHVAPCGSERWPFSGQGWSRYFRPPGLSSRLLGRQHPSPSTGLKVGTPDPPTLSGFTMQLTSCLL